jgi:hypothetical protein
MAELVAAVLPGAELQEHNIPSGADVAVIVGDEETFTTEPLLQILPIPLAKPADEPAACKQRGKLGDPHGG